MGVGEYLKKRRNELNLSLRKVAEAVQVNHSYISRIESGEKTPTREMLQDFAKVLEIDESELLRMQGFHAESKGTELEKEYPRGVDILYSANKDLDDAGKKVFELMMVEVKSALESREFKEAIKSGTFDIERFRDDPLSKALHEILIQAKEKDNKQGQ